VLLPVGDRPNTHVRVAAKRALQGRPYRRVNSSRDPGRMSVRDAKGVVCFEANLKEAEGS
jgi:hypothetical protein